MVDEVAADVDGSAAETAAGELAAVGEIGDLLGSGLVVDDGAGVVGLKRDVKSVVVNPVS